MKLLAIGGRAVRPPSTAPRDGSIFLGVPKHRTEPERMCWDAQMGCFLTEDFGCVDRLGCWLEEADR